MRITASALLRELRETACGLTGGAYEHSPRSYLLGSDADMLAQWGSAANSGLISDLADRKAVQIVVTGAGTLSIDGEPFEVTTLGGESNALLAGRLCRVLGDSSLDLYMTRTGATVELFGEPGKTPAFSGTGGLAVTDIASPRVPELLAHLREMAVEGLVQDALPFVQVVKDNSAITDATLRAVLIAYANAATPETFWSGSLPPNVSQGDFDTLKLLWQLSNLTLACSPLVGDILGTLAPAVYSDLIETLTPAVITSMVNAVPLVSLPAGLPGPDEAARRVAYARAIERALEDAFPSQILSKRIRETVSTEWQTIRTHVAANTGFNWDTIDPAPASELETFYRVQRLFKICHRWNAVSVLFEAGTLPDSPRFKGARDIARIPSWTFIQTYGSAMQTSQLARFVHLRATHIAGTVSATLGNLGGSTYAVLPETIHGRPSTIGGLSAPATEALLGGTDFRSVSHDDSVFGASAYFFDLLDFCYAHGINVPLAARRPDLRHLWLTSSNIHTRLPQIDLVIELLERKVAGLDEDDPANLVVETRDEQAALRAMPARTYWDAYESEGTLGTSSFPMMLPFDLAAQEARRYLALLGTAPLEVLRAFNANGMTAERESALAWAAASTSGESFGLDARFRAVLLEDHADLAYWGLTPADLSFFNNNPNAGATRELLRRADLDSDYSTFLECLGSRFVIGDGLAPGPNLSDPPNIDAVSFSGFSVENLGRLSQFLRLRRALVEADLLGRAESAVRLDRTLIGGVTEWPPALDAGMLDRVEVSVEVARRTGVSLDRAAAIWTGSPGAFDALSTYHLYASAEGAPVPSLYDEVYLSRLTRASGDDVGLSTLELNSGRDDLAGSPVKVGAAASEIAASLEIASDDLRRILEYRGEAGADWRAIDLTLPILGAFHAHAVMAAFLGLSVGESLRIQTLTGIDPFDAQSRANALALADVVAAIHRADLSVSEVDALLRHDFEPSLRLLSTQQEIDALLSRLNGVSQQVATALPRGLSEDASGPEIRTRLEEWGVSAASIDLVLEWVFTPPSRPPFPSVGAAELDFFSAAQFGTWSGATGKSIQEVLSELDEAVVLALRARLERTAYASLLAGEYGLDVSVMTRLLTEYVEASWAFEDPSPGQLAVVDALVPAGWDTSVGGLEGAWSNSMETRRAALARLEQTSLLLRRLELLPAEVDWLFAQHGVGSGLRTLPYNAADATTPAGAFGAFADTLCIRRLREQLGESDAFTSYVPDPNVDVALGMLEDASGWPRADVEALLDHFGGTSWKTGGNHVGPLADVRVWLRLSDAFGLAESTGVDVRTWISWQVLWDGTAAPAPTARRAAALGVRRATRLKLGETAWLEKAPAVRDELRQRQRDALVAYALDNPTMVGATALASAEDLSAYVLMDVLTQPKNTVSRLLQASSSIQTYVQRVLLNLEAGQSLAEDAREQWAWLKRYRVWEANRKIFLYPENYLLPELRDDKTQTFERFEAALQRGGLSDDAIGKAVGTYLIELNDIANLEVAATYHEVEYAPEDSERSLEPLRNNLHVVGRSRGEPARWYYRVWRDQQVWSGWSEIEVDLESELVALCVHNGVPYLFWIEYQPATSMPETDSLPVAFKGGGFSEVRPTAPPKGGLSGRLGWTRFVNGKWSERYAADDAFALRAQTNEDGSTTDTPHRSTRIQLEPRADGSLIVWVEFWGLMKLDPERFQELHFVIECIRFDPALNQAAAVVYDDEQEWGSGIPGDFNTLYQYWTPKKPLLNPWLLLPIPSTDAGKGQDAAPLRRTVCSSPQPYYLILTSAQERGLVPWHPTFYIDVRRTFLITVRDENEWSGGGSTSSSHSHPAAEGDRRILGRHLFDESSAFGAGVVEAVGRHGRTLEVRAGRSRLASGSVSDLIPTLTKRRPGVFLRDAKCAPHRESGVNTRDAEDGPGVQTVSKFVFHNFTHPMVPTLIREWGRGGIAALYRPDLQQDPTALVPSEARLPFDSYGPKAEYVADPWPDDGLEWSTETPYGPYNWELFFHVPFLVATRLIDDGQYERAQRWLHYIFDPTAKLQIGGAVDTARLWRFQPFYARQGEDQPSASDLGLILSATQGQIGERLEAEERLRRQVLSWLENPFRPHAVARTRTVAFEKAVVMKYLDCLVEWGDSLFRQDTLESVNEAGQLYMLAAQILGPRPIEMPTTIEFTNAGAPNYGGVRSYEQMVTSTSADIGLELERQLPRGASFVLDRGGSDEVPASAQAIPEPYQFFAVPANDALLRYWDTIGDRLFKIRNSMNIDGIERTLALFAPPIDPLLLARAAAAGVPLGEALSGVLSETIPLYRYQVLHQKALEFAGEVRQLGGALLSAIEKRDGEKLAVLRAGQELEAQQRARDVRSEAVKEAKANLESLRASKRIVEERAAYYSTREAISAGEQEQLDKSSSARDFQNSAMVMHAIVSQLSGIPGFNAGVAGAGGTAQVTMTYSAANITGSIGSAISALSARAAVVGQEGSIAGTRASYKRRQEEWAHQAKLANLEINQLERQILAGELRLAMAEHELRLHDHRIAQAKAMDTELRTKYSNEELYEWMRSELFALYRELYELAVNMARRAQRAFAFELGERTSAVDFIRLDHWDSARTGLLAGERLAFDLRRMDAAYLERNRREYQITKHVSLLQYAPEVLLQLRATGVAELEIDEALFDRDYPGHYLRRLQSVGVTIPAVSGPYEGVQCTLRMLKNKVRLDPNVASGYAEVTDPVDADARFAYQWGPQQAIVTSSGQQDRMVGPNDEDGRYRAFEGCGAVSRWQIKVPTRENGFDVHNLADVVLHLQYSSREGGEAMRAAAQTSAWTTDSPDNMVAFSLRSNFPDAWAALTDTSVSGQRVGQMLIERSHFPWPVGGTSPAGDVAIREFYLLGRTASGLVAGSAIPDVIVAPGGIFNGDSAAIPLAGLTVRSVQARPHLAPQAFSMAVDGAAFDGLSEPLEDVLLVASYIGDETGVVAPNSVDDPFDDWVASYLAPKIQGSDPYTWANEQGLGPTLGFSGAYSAGVATTGLAEAALGEVLTDGAMSPGAMVPVGTGLVWPTGNVHVRLLFRPSGETQANYLFRFRISANALVQGRFMPSNSLQLYWRNIPSDYTPTIGIPDGQWCLLDMLVEPTGGAGGVSRMRLWLNGTDVSPADDNEAIIIDGTGSLGLAGLDGTTGPMNGDFLFWGVRPAGWFTFAHHQLHANALLSP